MDMAARPNGHRSSAGDELRGDELGHKWGGSYGRLAMAKTRQGGKVKAYSEGSRCKPARGRLGAAGNVGDRRSP
jgi:hypothetical protein